MKDYSEKLLKKSPKKNHLLSLYRKRQKYYLSNIFEKINHFIPRNQKKRVERESLVIV